jgi:nitronate monooxygenase
VLHTPLCDRLEIRHPILQAPMAAVTTPELVAAVSAAGGLGQLAATRLSPDELRDSIRRVRATTDAPFGVNFLIAPPEPGNHDVGAVQDVLDRLRAELELPPGARELEPPASHLPALLEVTYEERAPVVSFALGDPAPFVQAGHDGGALVFAMVTTVEEAVRVEAAGVDVVIAQGAEAGGHRSTLDLGPDDEPPLVGTLALVPQVVDAVSIPVVAAGGIVDGRGVAAALVLGAQAAQLGTRFVVSAESGAPPVWQERLLAAQETDTLVTRAFTGRPARGLRNRLTREVERPLAWPLQALVAADVYAAGNAELFPLYTGQGVRLLKESRPAAQLVEELVAEATDALRLH